MSCLTHRNRDKHPLTQAETGALAPGHGAPVPAGTQPNERQDAGQAISNQHQLLEVVLLLLLLFCFASYSGFLQPPALKGRKQALQNDEPPIQDHASCFVLII